MICTGACGGKREECCVGVLLAEREGMSVHICACMGERVGEGWECGGSVWC